MLLWQLVRLQSITTAPADGRAEEGEEHPSDLVVAAHACAIIYQQIWRRQLNSSAWLAVLVHSLLFEYR